MATMRLMNLAAGSALTSFRSSGSAAARPRRARGAQRVPSPTLTVKYDAGDLARLPGHRPLRPLERWIGTEGRRGNAAGRQAGARTSKVLSHTPSRIEKLRPEPLAVLEADQDGARVLLARHLPPLVLTPEGSTYRITGGFDLSLCWTTSRRPAPWGTGTPPNLR
jgi:hypothetical protein